ncbi:hypothetical protein FOB64_005179 [Candida albicans]|uniref:SUMO ligase n=1 Tax=Candida albicans TaxID=5476 RepID=A0A8H6F0S9_CANAX|nr:hypothetical protein FOB64_005179 [Candida albicans]
MNQEFDQNSPYIYCDNKLLLTSCAHITCDIHLQSKHIESYLAQNDSDSPCPVCGSNPISTVPINRMLPVELKNFFIPTPQQIDLLTSSGKFQYCSLVDRINYYRSTISKMNEKLKKQKEFLYAAKEEITQLNLLRKQLQSTARPDTFDLSNDNENEKSGEFENNIFTRESSPTQTASHTFINKVHRESLQKVIPTSKPDTDDRNGSTRRRSFFAESTKLGEINSRSISSSNESSNSLNSLKRFSFESPKKKYLQNPIGKRSATSQLATRITANMKLGVPVSASNASSRSYQNGYVNKVSKDPTLTRTMRRAARHRCILKG